MRNGGNRPANPQAQNRVLLVDDDPAILRLLGSWLEQAGFDVRTANDGADALQLIEQEAPDYLLTDWEMPHVDGPELCRKVREIPLPNYMYVVFLTARNNRNDIIDALDAGADDFLQKPIQKNELLARMMAGGRVLELERRLSALARTDALTGLFTRRTFLEYLEIEWNRARRHGLPLTCVMFDIDFFKRVNDQDGHAAGDACLQTVARLTLRNSRGSDIVCRFGGDEFLALLTETTEEQAAVWAERLRKLVQETPVHAGHVKVRVTSSFGLAQAREDTTSPEQLIDMADQSLLAAKRLGRDCVVAHEMIRDRDYKDTAHVELFETATAGDVMVPIGLTLSEDEPVDRARRHFLKTSSTEVVIVDDEGNLRGTLSESKLMDVIPRPSEWSAPVSRYMATKIVSYDKKEPAGRIYEFLGRVNISRVLITDHEHPVGQVSRSSIMQWVAAQQSQGSDHSKNSLESPTEVLGDSVPGR